MSYQRFAGFKEAMTIMGWSKGHLNSYMTRGKFPKPIQTLASGPIWTEKSIIDYKKNWNSVDFELTTTAASLDVGDLIDLPIEDTFEKWEVTAITESTRLPESPEWIKYRGKVVKA